MSGMDYSDKPVDKPADQPPKPVVGPGS